MASSSFLVTRNAEGTVVSGGAGQIFGQVSARKVVRALMDRPEHDGVPRSLDRPVLVFEGAPGSGKTALVSDLANSLGQRVPHARVDLDVIPRPRSVPEVLSALAFELGRQCPRYGELRFPRFVIGQLVIREQLDLDNRQRACQQVTALLEKERNVDILRTILEQTADIAIVVATRSIGVPLPGSSSVVKHLSGWVFDRLGRSAPGRRIVLGSFQDWYGSRGRGLTNKSIDVLVDLNRWGLNPEDEANRQRIEELLWDAFLADLRAAFRGTKHAHNAVALIDNVDAEIGQRFLHGLVTARRRWAAEGQLAPDPLTVLATSRGGAG